MKRENKNTIIYKYFQILFNELHRMQYSLESSFRFPEFLHNKIVTACLRNPSCSLVFTDPPDEIGKLMNKLQIFILAYKNEKKALETQI